MGLAYGVVDGSTGLSGLVLPFVFDRLLYTYGAKTTPVACAVAMAVLAVLVVPILRPRLPQSVEAQYRQTSITTSYRIVFRQP